MSSCLETEETENAPAQTSTNYLERLDHNFEVGVPAYVKANKGNEHKEGLAGALVPMLLSTSAVCARGSAKSSGARLR